MSVSAGEPATFQSLRVIHHVATTVPGTGVDTFVLHLCAAQKRLGIEPRICCDVRGREEFMASARQLGIPVDATPVEGRFAARVPQKMRTALGLARETASLVRLLTRERPDVVHVHSISLTGLDVHLAATLTRIPVIVTHHSTLEYWRPYWRMQSDIVWWLEKWRTAYAVCPYRKSADELRDHGMRPAQLVVVPFCADEQRFTGAIKPPEPSGPLRLIIPSRLVREKGYAELLEAMAQLRHRYPQIRLSIVGTGAARADIEQTITRLHLGDIVEMLGHVPHARMPDLLRQHHLVVLPSYMDGETFPIALLEGMCMGMPCIGTRWFGIPDIIADGETGVLAEPRDAATLERAIEAFASDPAFFARASAAAAARAQREFTGRAVAARYRELYERASSPDFSRRRSTPGQ